jgi:hypothetical protein
MFKQSFVVVVLSLCAVLAAPAVASADHPWTPPEWWVDVIDGGTEDRSTPESDCVVHESTDEYDGQRRYFNCDRIYPAGRAACNGMQRHWRSGGREYYEFEFACGLIPDEDRAPRCNRMFRMGRAAYDPTEGDSGWRTGEQEDPMCFDRFKGTTPRDGDRDGVADVQDRCPGVAGPASNSGCPFTDQTSQSGGHDLVSVCGRARFDWYRSNFGDPDVEKGEEACLHTVSNRVAQQLAAEGIKAIPRVFGERLVDWAKGRLIPDPEDLIQRAIPRWHQAFRTVGRLNVITKIGEVVGLGGVASGYRFAANQITDKDACVMLMTSTSPNYGIDGASGTLFDVDGWQMVYNRKNVKHPQRDAELHTANVSQKYKRRLRRDRWETRMTSMRCGKGGKVFLTSKHDESKIVSNRVRAAG